jgi:hypothetical protein
MFAQESRHQTMVRFWIRSGWKEVGLNLGSHTSAINLMTNR